MSVPSVTVELLQAQNRKLREENEELCEEVRQLKEALAVDSLPTWLPYLTAGERRVLVCLSSGRLVSREHLLSFLYGDSDEPDTALTNIKVWVCRLRRKLAALGIDIRTVYGQGYQITPASRDLLADKSRVAA